MALSTAAKVAMCLCPPAVMAGTIATVPAAKRAVHHLTAPHHKARPVRHVASAAAHAGTFAARSDCDPTAGGALPAVPLVTYAAPIPDEPVGSGPGGRGIGAPVGGTGAPSPAVAFAPVGAAGGTSGTTGVTDPSGNTAPGPVPEPATWVMMILGAGTVGATWRRRRAAISGAGGVRTKVATGVSWWGSSVAAEAGDGAAMVAGKSTMAGVASKAMMCVCPAVVAAGGVMTVPPVRQAVHAATAPSAPVIPRVPAATGSGAPCNPVIATPVSAAAVKGFPDVVSTAVPDAAPPASQIAALSAAPVLASATGGGASVALP